MLAPPSWLPSSTTPTSPCGTGEVGLASSDEICVITVNVVRMASESVAKVVPADIFSTISAEGEGVGL